MTTVIESCRIRPPAEVASGELLVPLSFMDIFWLPYHPLRYLLFYEYPCSESSFLKEVIPQLKQSLSLTLRHYLPVAGNLLYPSDVFATTPVFRYAAGDSVRLTIAKSSHDFGELIGDHGRDADQFYGFVPPTPSPSDDYPGYRTVPPVTLQVTLFPGRGICLGLAIHHSLGDARSIQGFLSAWASTNKDGGGGRGELGRLPVFDRSVIGDSHGIDATLWEEVRHAPFDPSPCFPIPSNRVRATFTLGRGDIDRLKAKTKPAALLSSFVVTTSYVWSCLAKSGGDQEDESELQMLIFWADALRLMNPAVPANYFGNCLAAGAVILDHKKLVGDEGFVTAAREIGGAVRKLVKGDKDEFGKRGWPFEDERIFEGVGAITTVSGSPKFDYAAADFGWGKLRSQEVVSMDEEKYSMSLSNSVGSQGGLAVGMSLPRARMEAFAALFADGLSL